MKVNSYSTKLKATKRKCYFISSNLVLNFSFMGLFFTSCPVYFICLFTRANGKCTE